MVNKLGRYGIAGQISIFLWKFTDINSGKASAEVIMKNVQSSCLNLLEH
jgi:hypothetical protein